MKQRKIPQRMCVSCREMRDKKDLMRLVRTRRAEGEDAFDVEYDKTGKKSGRGAYICASVECLARAKKTGAIYRALNARPEDALYEGLEREILRRDL